MKARHLIVCVVVILVSSVNAYEFAGGTGEPDDPYQIATAQQLCLIGSDPNFLDKCFVLVNDVDLDPNLPDGCVFDQAVIAPDLDDSKQGFQGSAFTGCFDGRAHAITNLTIDSISGYAGLFGLIGTGGVVCHVDLVGGLVRGEAFCGRCGTGGLASESGGSILYCYSNIRVRGMDHVGGLLGENRGIVSNSYSTGTVGPSGSDVGGLVGYNSGMISSCFSTAAVSGVRNVGGLLGENGGAIANSYSTGTVSGTKMVGGLAGLNSDGSISNSYSAGPVNGEQYVSGLVGRNDGTVFNSFWDVNASDVSGSDGGIGLTTAEMQNRNVYLDAGWDFQDEVENGVCEIWQMPRESGYPNLSVLQGYVPQSLHGSGTAENPYIVRELDDFGGVNYHPTAYYKLEADIDMSSMVWTTAVLPGFAGQFDGQGHLIRNLSIRGNGYLGLFGLITPGATVLDLGLDNVEIVGAGRNVGSVAGYISHSTISNILCIGTVSGADSMIGGLVGFSECGVVANSFYTGSVSSSDWYVGGLVGANSQGIISNSYSTGTVRGRYHVGGLVGSNGGSTINSYSSSSVSGTDNYVGGLVGSNGSGSIVNSYSRGTVSGPVGDMGGLVGSHSSGTVENSFWDVESSGMVRNNGGNGLTSAQMQDPNTYLDAGWDFLGERGNGTSEAWLIPTEGGYPELSIFRGNLPTLLFGLGTLDDPYIVATPDDLGMVLYRPTACYRLVEDVDLSGAMWSTAVIPTFAGKFDGQGHRILGLSISAGGRVGLFGTLAVGASVNSLGLEDVNIVGMGSYVGSLVGHNLGVVSRSYSTGLVSGINAAGGLVGFNSGRHAVGGSVGYNSSATISNSYSTVSVHGKELVGGLVGANYGSASNSYSTGSVSGVNSRVGGLSGMTSHGTVDHCFWDIATSGQTVGKGGIGLMTSEMQTFLPFLDADWDFIDTWMICEGRDYPRLQWEGVDCGE